MIKPIRFFALVLFAALMPLPALGAESISLLAPCTQDQLASWAEGDGGEGSLNTANCCAYLAMNLTGSDAKDAMAVKGRAAAQKYVQNHPDSGQGQYLLAVLTGLVAQDEPWYDEMSNGLKLVPEIVAHAAKAAELTPEIAHGGPDRALGQVYLQAPAPPMSVGDPHKAVAHFQQALKYAPDYPPNYLNLAKALFKTGDAQNACARLKDMQQLTGQFSDSEKKDMASGASLYSDKCRNN